MYEVTACKKEQRKQTVWSQMNTRALKHNQLISNHLCVLHVLFELLIKWDV